MKKSIAYILVALLIAVAGIGLGVSAFNNANNNKPNTEVQGDNNDANVSDEDLMKKAVAYVKTIYKDVEKETAADFERIGTVPVGKAKFTVDWSVDVDENIIKIVKQENGMVTIDINEEIGDETPYVLTATISDGKGNKESLTWDHVIPAKITGSYAEIVDMAYALKNGEKLPNVATLQGTVTTVKTAWDPGYKNITVVIAVEGREDKPIECYRLKSGAADASKIEKGDLITVTGYLKNYNGTIEFDAGCVLDANEKGAGKIAKVEGSMLDIVKKAYALKDGESLPGEATLAGSVISVDDKWNSSFKNITVTIVVDGSDRAHKIKCYRMVSGAADAEKVKAGDHITVTGVLKNYKGTIEFDAGCTLDKLVVGGGTVAVDKVETPEVVTGFKTGDKVVIWNPAHNVALSTEAKGYYSAGVKVTYSNGVLRNYTDATIFEIVDNGDGTYSFTQNGKKFGMGDEFTSMSLGAKNDKWQISQLKNGRYYIMNTVREAYMEWYDSNENWSAYYTPKGDLFELDIYVIPKEVPPATLADAVAKLKADYADAMNKDGEYTLVPSITIDGTTFNVAWAIDTADATVATIANGKLVIAASTEKDVTYKLTATVSDAKGSEKVEWTYTVAKKEAAPEDATPGLEVGNGYKFYLEQVTLGKTLYFAGTVSSAGYLETTEDIALATEVYVEEVTDGVRFYFMDGDTKTYIEIFKNSSDKVRHQLVTTPTMVYTYSEEAETYVANIDGTDYYTGTYSNYNTFSASKTSYITGDNAANVGVSQFVAKFVDYTPGLVVDNGYKFYLEQVTLGKTLYFAGTVSSAGYLESTDDIASAVDVYVEEVADGVRFYFMNGTTKTYIEIYKNSSNKIRHQLVTAPTMVYTYSEEAGTYVANIDGTDYYTGTYSNYNTFSASKTSYITGDNAANVGVSQFVAYFVDNTPGLENGVAYKYYLDQVTLGETLYFAGTVSSSGYLETTNNVALAADVYVEEVTDGVRFYFMDGETKTYIEIYKNSSNKIRHQLVTTPTMVYTYSEEAGTYVANIDGTDYYTGTYSNYNTFSASKTSYITGDNAANVGVSQFVAYFEKAATNAPTVTAADILANITSTMANVDYRVSGDYTLTTTVTSGDVTYNVTWTSSNVSVASIVPGGTLTVVAPTNANAEFTLTAVVTNAADETDTATDDFGPYLVLQEVNVAFTEDSYFEKVTTAPTDWTGTYLIVYEEGSLAYNGSLTTVDVVNNGTAVTIADNKIAVTDALKTAYVTIVKQGDEYIIKAASDLFIGNTDNSNKLYAHATPKYTNTLSMNDDGSVNIIGSGGAYLRFNNAGDQMRFRYYKSSSYTNQQPIALYKLVEAE